MPAGAAGACAPASTGRWRPRCPEPEKPAAAAFARCCSSFCCCSAPRPLERRISVRGLPLRSTQSAVRTWRRVRTLGTGRRGVAGPCPSLRAVAGSLGRRIILGHHIIRCITRVAHPECPPGSQGLLACLRRWSQDGRAEREHGRLHSWRSRPCRRSPDVCAGS